MTLLRYIRLARSFPLPVLVSKVRSKLYQQFLYQLDLRQSSYGHFLDAEAELHRYLPAISAADLQPYAPQIAALNTYYRAHRFDLLGSGWVHVKHGIICQGLEGYSYSVDQPDAPDVEGIWLEKYINPMNLAESRRIWKLVDRDYVPIDWQLDFKSGYRWHEKTSYRSIQYGHLPGVDIKVPWELARAQHLPQLAWGYALALQNQTEFGQAEPYSREFQNQILDFIATNPPRFGVNWACTMDVAIRAVNWLVTYDLFRAYGASFDTVFKQAFINSIYQHGKHIIGNLEWNLVWRSNHYLANIAGLLFIAAYLPQHRHVDAWLAFAVQELNSETRDQFNADGSNFEASSSYHRLSAEMIVYASALALGLPNEKKAALTRISDLQHQFPLRLQSLASNHARLERMGEFTAHLTKPNGRIPQIGDNDNGRFLKLMPVYNKLSNEEAHSLYSNLEGAENLPGDYWDEDILNHQHLLAAINGIFRRDDWPTTIETTLVSALAKTQHLPSYHQGTESSLAEFVTIGDQSRSPQDQINHLPNKSRMVIPIGFAREGLHLYAYPDFGVYIFRSGGLYLAVRCGSIGQQGNGGHAHNDQLAIELNVNGEDWISDVGTYLYTPLPVQRNCYRSVRAHFAPQLLHDEKEPASLDLGIFQLEDSAKAKCLYFGQQGFVGVHYGYGVALYRCISIEPERIIIEDGVEDGQPLRHFDDYRWPQADLALSPKYGSKFRWQIQKKY